MRHFALHTKAPCYFISLLTLFLDRRIAIITAGLEERKNRKHYLAFWAHIISMAMPHAK